MLVRTRESASENPDGRPKEWRLNMSFHRRRVPRPSLIRCLARERNSRFEEGEEEVGMVPVNVLMGNGKW
ncbi:hypothetical protein HN51_037842 [Arachis hypogaea]